MTAALAICALLAGCAEQSGTHPRESISSSKDSPPAGWSTAAGPPAVRGIGHEVAAASAAVPPKTASIARPSAVVQTAGQEVVPAPAGTSVTPQPESAAPVILSPPPGNEPLITLHVADLDVRKALEILSRQAKMNILVSPGVSGKVTVDLHDKTLDEVLATMAKLCDMSVHREKDIIYVTTPAEQRAAEEDDLPVRVYHLNYVKSKDVSDMIKPLLSKSGSFSSSPDADTGYPNNFSGAPGPGGGGGGGGGNTKAGGNSLAGGDIVIVQDYEHVLKTVDRVIAQIDVQPLQVLIEAVIVSVRIDKDLDLGVNYAILDGSGKALGVVGNGSILNATAGFTPATVLAGVGGAANTLQSVTTAVTGQPTTNTTTLSTGTNGQVAGNTVNGFAQNTYGMKYGWTGKNVTGFISALQTRGETKVLAAPRILVLNKQPAEIHLGDNLGYQTSTVSQTSTT